MSSTDPSAVTAARVLAGLYPREVTASADLCRALEFLDTDLAPEDVIRAGYGLGAVVAILTLPVTVIFGLGSTGLLVSVALALLSMHLVHTLPRIVALSRRTRALGSTPDLVARAVLRMRLSPSPERAAEFTANAEDGPLEASLREHVRRARLTGKDAFRTFGAAWEEWYPNLTRSLSLVSAAGSMDARDREQTLDQAMTVVLDGTRSSMRSFATRIERPVTALYAFGVLLPTALVALLPAAHAAGVGVTIWTVVAVYDVLVPVGLVAAAAWLVVHRPVAFPPPRVDCSHPDVPQRPQVVLAVGTLSAVGAWLIADRFLPRWAGPVCAIGIGVGTTLWIRYRPVVAVYERIRTVEAGLSDALSLVGRRVASGVAVETAIETAASEMDGEMGTVLEQAATRQRQLTVGVRAAFLGENGALSDLPSPRVRGSVAVLGLAAEEGQPAGSALLALADHVEDLHRVEREARQDMESVCGTLRATGALFGPMVAGATVALADGIAGSSALPGSQSLPWLGLAVGGYVLAFAVVLPALATGLQRGFDGPLVGYHVGRALVLASVVYPASYVLVAGIA